MVLVSVEITTGLLKLWCCNTFYKDFDKSIECYFASKALNVSNFIEIWATDSVIFKANEINSISYFKKIHQKYMKWWLIEKKLIMVIALRNFIILRLGIDLKKCKRRFFVCYKI